MKTTKHILILMLVLLQITTSCDELQQVLETTGEAGITNFDIANGLKEALQNGVSKQVVFLGKKDGFLKNQMVKILYPEELQKVDKTLRKIGLSNLADKGLEMLNRAAEDAVSEAIPVFRDAIYHMTIQDAKNILMGNSDAATQYLKRTTSNSLRAKFSPIIQRSFQKVGADKIWNDIITQYNKIPFVDKVNPDITAYTTGEALKGVYKMIAVEELKIRSNIKDRTSELLRKVFALQDKKPVK